MWRNEIPVRTDDSEECGPPSSVWNILNDSFYNENRGDTLLRKSVLTRPPRRHIPDDIFQTGQSFGNELQNKPGRNCKWRVSAPAWN
jgi:hypothetical protein